MTYKLLVVEDDKLDQIAFTRLVEKAALPYDYRLVETVAEGRALCGARRFDAVLVDYELPDGTGFDLLDAVPAHVAVIFVTGAGSEETAIRALRAGASDYLIKDAERVYLRFLPLTIERAVQQKRNERQLWTLSQAVMSSSDCIYVTDLEEHITHVNDAFCATYGYEAQEIIGRSCRSLLAQGSIPRQFAGTSELESFHQRRDGRRFPVSMTRTAVRDGRGAPFAYVAVVRDITQRRRAELALRESEERYRSVVTAMADGVLLQDGSGRVRACNGSAERILGVSMHALRDLQHETPLWHAIREDGTPFAAHEYPARVTLRTGTPQHQVIMGVLQPDETVTWISVNTEPLRHRGEAQPFAVVSSFTDITQLKSTIAERDQLIKYLDSFAHTVAHDLKNPASLLLGYATLLAADYEKMPLDEIKRGLGAIESAAYQVTQIIEALLLLASTSNLKDIPLNVVDMSRLVAAAENRLQERIERSNAEIVVAPDLPPAVGYAPWVVEMLVNYISNAIKYGGRPPRVEIGAEPGDQLVRYWVRDNGPGLTTEEQEQLFQPFMRLHRTKAEGHGLGLSIVRQIAERLGGSADVTSKVGQGSEFSFTLPAPRRRPAVENPFATLFEAQ